MDSALVLHRIQFAFTIVYHYLFPVLSMGLAFLIFVMKALGLRQGGEGWNDAARFWIRIFGINFAVGVVTGIPMEFQFGTNWARFSNYAGNVIGHTLAMEGLFAFFLESSFLYLLIRGEERLGRIGHFLSSAALFVGSWLSGYFIIATNAFMQHPVGYSVTLEGKLRLEDFWAFLLNPWALAQYAHNMISAVVTASFVVTALGAFYTLNRQHADAAARFLKIGITAGLVSSILVAFPTGDAQAKLVAKYQPVSLAAMEGRFEGGAPAGIVLIGQPNVAERRLDNPIIVPGILSFLAYGQFHAEVRGLNDFKESEWPDNIELLYYSFHVMAGLGTIMIGIMAIAALMRARGALEHNWKMLWILMVSFPFPYIAITAGWMTTELARQPWLIYGLMRTADGSSQNVHAGSTLFTLIGFCGLYLLLGVIFLYMIASEISHGPVAPSTHSTDAQREVVHV
ncbi:MAG: cytochrome ubiquinol oxidase subunit I [Vicinamibacteria bacterium]